MDPIHRPNPTLHHVLLELLSAQSSLNMPTPRETDPDYVEHAYKHLDAAVVMLAGIMELQKAP